MRLVSGGFYISILMSGAVLCRLRKGLTSSMKTSLKIQQKTRSLLIGLAPQVGLEPTTTRLTAECSAIELLRNIESGNDIVSRAVSSQVPSARGGLTSVFGMGTGGTLQPLSPEIMYGALPSSSRPSLRALPSLAFARSVPALLSSGFTL